MKHTPVDALHDIAEVRPAQPMSRLERLRRWASLLERDPARVLRPLYRVELYAEVDRARLRGDNTPLSVAFADPVLREQGLESDRFGDGGGFFGLNSRDLHALVCDCRYGGRMRAGDVARRLRSLTHPSLLRRVWARLWL